MAELQKDLVLNPNEYAYILDRTKGAVVCHCGPTKTSLSNTDAPVNFNTRTKRFEECSVEESVHLFVTAPENWYCVLKNPAPEGAHPTPRSVNDLPQLNIGKKVNINGPATFALFPGQMARVIQGHRLRSNQYLLVRVYDEDAARENWANSVIKTIDPSTQQTTDESGEKNAAPDEAATPSINAVSTDTLTVGKIRVIKGTEVSFYIPPTGIEVIPVEGSEYIREAVTLERLEYCILKDENGNKRYVHGPAVVFPEPTEAFVPSQNGYKFRAIELSEISGIYVKVIAEYDENDHHHNVGEELFITGKDRMIYYPRPEHAIINYGGRTLHHAVAIPEGEGRYVMDRMTGKISTVKGPTMLLPDPRKQVIVKRKLTKSQAALWYPNNDEVRRYNETLGRSDEDEASEYGRDARTLMRTKTGESFEPGAFLNRNTSFTPPRTITIDNKFEGVVSIDVWTGYAINVIAKDGTRKVVIGPCTYLMEYDETLEILEMSTGKPKTTDNLIRTVFLRVDNNKIGDIINVQTKDFVNVEIKVSYCVNFDRELKDRWFSVENYVKYLCDRIRSLLKREVKKYTIDEFYQDSTDIVRKVVLNMPEDADPNGDAEYSRKFAENGMVISDVEVLTVRPDSEVAAILEDHQSEMIENAIQLSDAAQREAMTQRLADSAKAIATIEHESEMYKLDLRTKAAKKRAEQEKAEAKIAADAAMQKLTDSEARQKLMDSINDSELARQEKVTAAEVDRRRKYAAIEKERRDAYAAAMKTILDGISPQLAASIQQLSMTSNMSDIAQALSPLAIVGDTSIADTANKLLKGTALEGVLEAISRKTVIPEAAVDTDDE